MLGLLGEFGFRGEQSKWLITGKEERGEVLKSRSCLAVRLLRDGIERLLLPHG